MGTEMVIEESFIDVFCNLMYGGGWMEIEGEEVDRECNWALVGSDVIVILMTALMSFANADRVQVPSII
jgi:roadblock/LC7 domain-containing protein